MKTASLAVAILLACMGTGRADLVWRVDFNGATGGSIGATEATSNFVGWTISNAGAGPRTQTFANVDGGPASELKITLNGITPPGSSSNWSGYARTQAGSYTNLYRDGIQFSGTNVGGGVRLTLSQLEANAQYAVRLWSYDYSFGNANTQTYYDVTGGGNTLVGTVAFPPNNNAAGLPNDLYDARYLMAYTFTSSGAGEIDILVNSREGQNQKFNAIEVVQIVPEPSMIALLGLGAVALRLARRRMR